MHAEIRLLIAIRDGEPVDAAIATHVAECAVCERRLEELARVRTALREMPQLSPPPDAWRRIVAQRNMESLPSRRATPRRAAAGLMAVLSVALSAGIALRDGVAPVQSGRSVDAVSTRELRERSRELEYLLERYDTPGVMSLHVAGAISELEDSIALIDYQLNAAQGEQARDLWEQRVDLMEALVSVRAAETYLESI